MNKDYYGATPAARVTIVAGMILDKVFENTERPDRYSQLGRVTQELSSSVCEAALRRRDTAFTDDTKIKEFMGECAERIRSVIVSIPPAFHNVWLPTNSGGRVEPFGMPFHEMKLAAQDVAGTEPKKIVEAYQLLWRHLRATHAPGSAQVSEYERDLFLSANPVSLEDIANDYLSNEDFVSPLLEWALVDALLYCRISEFGNTARFVHTLPALPTDLATDGPFLPKLRNNYAVPLGPLTSLWTKVLIVAAGGLINLGLYAALELLLLFVTWEASLWLAGNDGVAKWVLFSAVTAGRWIAWAVYSNGPKGLDSTIRGNINLQMLWDMSIAHERVRDMNIGLLRHLFYKLEERGAAFHSCVYKILDKRAKREAGADFTLSV